MPSVRQLRNDGYAVTFDNDSYTIKQKKKNIWFNYNKCLYDSKQDFLLDVSNVENSMCKSKKMSLIYVI